METKFELKQNAKLKCNRCLECNGFGCPNSIPGLGGVFDGKNFQLNFLAWRKYHLNLTENSKNTCDFFVSPKDLACGPVTGAVENIGYKNEEDFYFPYLNNANKFSLNLCVGDGFPDEKLMFGLNAIQRIGKKAAFFLKPYPDEKLFERIDLVKNNAEFIGIDIDSFNIKTMRNLVNLEQKTAKQIQEFRKYSKIPFVLKGVFTQKDKELVKSVKPDVVYISNHGGRVETRIGSTADFLAENYDELKNFCSEIWVDGGIRTKNDVIAAKKLGAKRVIIARPLIRATFDNNYEEEIKKLEDL